MDLSELTNRVYHPNMDPQTTTTQREGRTSTRHQHGFSKLNYKQAVLSTLAYFDLFEYPLTLEETNRYLFQIEPDLHHIEITLNESKFIKKRGSYYQLIGPKDNIATRHERALIAKRLWKRVNRFRKIFALVPYLELIAVCNNLAYSNTKLDSDIDLFIVTRSERMFTARLFLTFWLQLLGVRRHGKKIGGRFCLSFFTTGDNLDFTPIKKDPLDIYLAYWIQTLQPITGDRTVYDTILHENHPWLNKIFTQPIHPNMYRFKEGPKWATALKKLQERILDSKWGEKLENHLQTWQLKRAHKKRILVETENPDHGIIINPKMLKFHNIDRRKIFYEQWIKKLKSIL